ncbi:MAG: IclR family transcriptional regulator [Micrococcales bacterium]|nr:IclR family transcriptional regulator [Micrococcales bacterium]
MTAGSSDGQRGLVQSVQRAINLLDAVSEGPEGGELVTVLAQRCGLNRATAWRLLATLEANDLVYVDPVTHRYSLGLAVTRLGTASSIVGLTRRAQPVLEELSRQTGETADLAVLQRLSLTYVAEVAPDSVLAAKWLGRTVALHATSSGKALLAWLPDNELEQLLEQPLMRYTPSTITSREALRHDLSQTRARGYGTCLGELEENLYGVSAPVLDDRGRPFAVVSIWGPRSRVGEYRFPQLGTLVQEAAEQIKQAVRRSGKGARSPTWQG